MSEEIINFSYNWNNKLDCKAFTTIRLYNEGKYAMSKHYGIRLKDNFIGRFYIRDIKGFMLNDITSYMSFLDTGYSIDETKAIIKKMYPKVDFGTQKLMFILLVKAN